LQQLHFRYISLSLFLSYGIGGENSVDQFSRSSAFWSEISFSDNAGATIEKYPLSGLKYSK
jgi:hypothetical protein